MEQALELVNYTAWVLPIPVLHGLGRMTVPHCCTACLYCRGPPLYVGSVPSTPPAAYSALLAYKPDKSGSGAAAVIASQMASR
jgi:hypothetical protein